ncbi:MAG: zinc-ribbon domain-containing protein [Bacilli bacterium]|nr:zinc-ribbon domain-containing protein [Bacilli bacterium]
MFCKNCGNELNNNDKFCKNCGSTNDQYVETPVVEEPTDNTFMNTQPFSIDEVAQKVEENKEAEMSTPVVETPTVEEPVAATSVEPAVEVPTEPVVEAPAPTISSTPIEPVINTPQKKSNVGFIIILITLIVIILGLGGFIGYKLFSGKTDTPTVTPSNNNQNNNNQNNNQNNNNNNTQKDETYSTVGYTFTIPTGYSKIDEGGSIRVGDSKFQFRVMTTITQYTYANYKSDLEASANEIKKVWGADGASYISSSEQTYNGKNFLIFSFVYQGTYNDAILTELPDGTLLCVVAYYNDLSSKTEGYNNLAKFVKSAVKDTNSSFSGDSKVEFKSSSIEKID